MSDIIQWSKNQDIVHVYNQIDERFVKHVRDIYSNLVNPEDRIALLTALEHISSCFIFISEQDLLEEDRTILEQLRPDILNLDGLYTQALRIGYMPEKVLDQELITFMDQCSNHGQQAPSGISNFALSTYYNRHKKQYYSFYLQKGANDDWREKFKAKLAQPANNIFLNAY